MSKKKIPSRRLVVDASIARAAGSPDSKHPTGVRCRDFLLGVRSVCHRVAWTDAIKREWDQHDSTFARQWRVSMFKLNKLIPLKRVENPAIREGIEEACGDAAILAIVLKDYHLVEAALATDYRITSLDEQVRGHLARLAAAVEALRPIVWVNPAAAHESAVEWLENGAPAEPKRRLGRK